MSQFVHLNVHTEYSLVDSVLRIPKMLAVARERNIPAIAMTDHNNLFAAVKFYRQAVKNGVKPIIGAEVLVENEKDIKHPFVLILLCQNKEGYRSLTRLVSRAYTEGQHHHKPMLQYSWLTPESVDGLIALSGGIHGDVGQAILSGKAELIDKRLQFWQALFPTRFYLEVSRIEQPGESNYINSVLKYSVNHQLPLVATNAVRFLDQADYDVHEARVCIHDGYVLEDNSRPRFYTEQQYLKSATEMESLFSDMPQALENALEIAKRCNLEMKFGEVYLPNFPIPEGQTIAEYLQQKSTEGLLQRLQGDAISEEYQQRLTIELKVICDMGFAGYFLIVADFIQWAKSQKIPVGPGRGSGAGSIVAYALEITDLDPIEHELLFERFLNPERISMPDFDIDFCMDKRDLVIDYVAQKYGRESVSQIITYGTMAAKAVVRDVGRVLGHPYGFVDKIAKLIPFEIGMTLTKALEQEQVLQERYNEEEEVQTLIDLARSLEGVVRNAGKHAGGVVISPSLLTDFAPLYCEADGENIVTQFDKDDIETVGLVKFDFLGLRTLTIIDWAVQSVNELRRQNNEAEINITKIPLDDEASYKLLCATTTTAVFQLESRGMKDLIKRLQPDCFEEIIALVALFRPGPLQSGMVDDFVDRKHGRAKVVYPHEKLESILAPTYGVILYQEQVMQIAQVLAGYTLGGADILRRAMGKKKPEEMAKQREIFVTGCVQRKVDEATATGIFDLMEKFAGYGFNKSHSAAYALIAYQTAWLKTHYPAAFMAAVLSSDMDNTDKVVAFIDECKALCIKIIAPNVNLSRSQFYVDDAGHIIFGLGAIKGVGHAAVDIIIQSREQEGPFQDLFDFCRRVDLRKVNRRVMIALITSGAMDDLKTHRASLLLSLDKALQLSEQNQKNQETGMTDLFADHIEVTTEQAAYLPCEPWQEEQLLDSEKEALGFYFSGHPLDRYQKEIRYFITAEISRLKLSSQPTVVIAGMIAAIRTMTTKRNSLMAFLTITDQSGRIELAVFPEMLQQHREILEKGNIIVIEGDVLLDEQSGNYRLSCRQIYTMAQARMQYAKNLNVTLKEKDLNSQLIIRIKAVLEKYNAGELPVKITYRGGKAQATIRTSRRYCVLPNDELLTELRTLLGNEEVQVDYHQANSP